MRPFTFLATASLAVAGGLYPPTIPAGSALDNGYRQMYNLDFSDAHNTFREWKTSHPGDPLGPASDAAAYLFAEFDRLHILQSELFTEDSEFKSRSKPGADAGAKQAFLKQLDDCERLANTALSHDAQDKNAKFAKILQSLEIMKTGRVLAQDLLAKDPSAYDAYLAVGVENYMLGIKPAPVRWVLSWTGAQTDKDQGIRELKLTAEKGHYLQPFARLLLAVAALRDKDRTKARDLLAGLAHEFPNNQLYKKELARLQ
jgi:hypothetical protein